MKKLEHQRPGAKPTEDIEDAEFEEIELAPLKASNGSQPPPSAPPTLGQWWRHQRFIIKAAVIFVPLLVLAMCVAGPPPELDPESDSTAHVPLDVSATDPIDEPAEATSITIEDLLKQNSPQACSDVVLLDAIKSDFLPITNPSDSGLSDDEWHEALQLAQADFEAVAATDIRSDLHRIECSANWRYGPDEEDIVPVVYLVQLAAKTGEAPLYKFEMPPFSRHMIMRGPTEQIIARRRAQTPPVEMRSPVSPPQPSTSPTAEPTPRVASDEELFAPRP